VYGVGEGAGCGGRFGGEAPDSGVDASTGMSVARVAQAEGVNSHQVFQWRRAYRQGGLDEAEFRSSALLPVVLAERRQEHC